MFERQASEEYSNTRLSVAVAQAEAYGCTIEYADDDVLQLDLDSDEAFERFQTQLTLFNALGIVHWNGYTERRSKSGNRHITIPLLLPLTVVDRILLQACLGSDLKRELLSYARVVKGIEHPVLLFRPKEGSSAAGTGESNAATS